MTDTRDVPDATDRPSRHPAILGRDRELRHLADAVRRLALLTVTNTAPGAETEAIASGLDRLAERLASYVPEERFSRFAPADDELRGPVDASPYDIVHGPFNPLALPVEMSLDPPRAIGRARFNTLYEGPPGCVHGAVLASVFDMVFSAANHLADTGGPTVRLSVDYRHPTRLEHEAVFEGWVAGREGRKVHTAGRVTQNGVVTVEAVGTFVTLPRDDVMRLGQPRDA
jgi:acyl-coenzyme A thioesterase PaaI-like protein